MLSALRHDVDRKFFLKKKFISSRKCKSYIKEIDDICILFNIFLYNYVYDI